MKSFSELFKRAAGRQKQKLIRGRRAAESILPALSHGNQLLDIYLTSEHFASSNYRLVHIVSAIPTSFE